MNKVFSRVSKQAILILVVQGLCWCDRRAEQAWLESHQSCCRIVRKHFLGNYVGRSGDLGFYLFEKVGLYGEVFFFLSLLIFFMVHLYSQFSFPLILNGKY